MINKKNPISNIYLKNTYNLPTFQKGILQWILNYTSLTQHWQEIWYLKNKSQVPSSIKINLKINNNKNTGNYEKQSSISHFIAIAKRLNLCNVNVEMWKNNTTLALKGAVRIFCKGH